MTKHLRLIMLSLLAMICLGGYSAVGDTYKLVISVAELNDGDVIVIANSDNQYAMGKKNTSNRSAVKVNIANGIFSYVDEVAELTLKASNNEWQFYSAEGYLCASGGDGKNTKASNKLTTVNDKDDARTKATINISGKDATIKFNKDVAERNWIRFNPGNSSSNPLFNCYASGQQPVQIYKKQNSNLTPTNTTFGEGVDNNTFEVKDGEIVETRVATVTPVEATGSIVYESSDEAIAKVDAETGAITLGAKYGTAVITAKFVATGSFANSEASYRIKHVGDFVFYESFDKCDGKGGNDGSFKGTGNDKVECDNTDGWNSKTASGAYKCVKIGSGNSGGYVETPSIAVSTTCRLSFKAASWAGDNSTISVTISSGKLTYNNGEPKQTITINPNDKEWTDYSMIVSGTKSFTVKFACSGKDNRFFLDEVMVTPQEITLDENSDNIVEAAENVNVTLKRTFYKDGEWNTLCLPFAVADAKTAFDNAELREVDTKNSNGNTIVFKKATAIEAGKPYLIKWANTSTEAVDFEKKFEGVTLVAAATPVEVNNGGISFNGFYKMTEARELGASVAAIGAGNKLFKVTEGKMKGFRAAFVLSSGAEATGYRVVIDGTATGIEDLVIDGVKANGRVYNLNGQYVGNSLNGLQPGLYIQNGKKIVVK